MGFNSGFKELMPLSVAQTWHRQNRSWSVIRNGVRGRTRSPVKGSLSGFTLGMRKITLNPSHDTTRTNRD